MLSTCWDKSCEASQDGEAPVAAGGIRSAEKNNNDHDDDDDEEECSHSPGCEHGAFSAATPSTGRRA